MQYWYFYFAFKGKIACCFQGIQGNFSDVRLIGNSQSWVIPDSISFWKWAKTIGHRSGQMPSSKQPVWSVHQGVHGATNLLRRKVKTKQKSLKRWCLCESQGWGCQGRSQKDRLSDGGRAKLTAIEGTADRQKCHSSSAPVDENMHSFQVTWSRGAGGPSVHPHVA